MDLLSRIRSGGDMFVEAETAVELNASSNGLWVPLLRWNTFDAASKPFAR
jgi:hypothetical protein